MADNIRAQRIIKEKEALKKLSSSIYSYNFNKDDSELIVNINDKLLGLIKINILLVENYPFEIPLIKIEFQNKDIILNVDYENFQSFNIYFKNKWTCKLTLEQIIQEVQAYISRYHISVKAIPSSAIFNSMRFYGEYFKKYYVSILIILIAIMFRIGMGFGSYSGINDPPQYGDYEAQRHWMELTYNTPTSEWYQATPTNNLSYWRIDYPPMTAYHSWIMGAASSIYEPDSMKLVESHGYETPTHKFFMRMTVLINDLIFFFVGTICTSYFDLKKYNFYIKWISLLLIFMAPPNVLIDHGHFQYNCVILGLTLLGYYFCCKDQIVIGSILYTCALNFKQMAFYYAFAFFAFILGRIIFNAKKSSQPLLSVLLRVLFIGFVVILVTFLIWLPWATSKESFFQVVEAIFPFHRGLFQHKVATFWCVTSIVIKWERIFPIRFLTIMTSAACIVFSLPSMIATIIHANPKTFKWCLFNVSMCFFFFSFHVHEKTILIPLLGLGLCIRHLGYYYLDFVAFACMSMFYLFRYDIMDFQYFVCTPLFFYFGWRMLQFLESVKFLKQNYLKKDQDYKKINTENVENKIIEEKIANNCLKLICFIDKVYFKLIRIVLYSLIILFHLAEKFIKPPAHLPGLWFWFIDILAFFVFAIIWIRSNLFLFYVVSKAKSKEKKTEKKIY